MICILDAINQTAQANDVKPSTNRSHPRAQHM